MVRTTLVQKQPRVVYQYIDNNLHTFSQYFGAARHGVWATLYIVREINALYQTLNTSVQTEHVSQGLHVFSGNLSPRKHV